MKNEKIEKGRGQGRVRTKSKGSLWEGVGGKRHKKGSKVPMKGD